MYELETQQVSLKTTPNHRMWVATSHTRKRIWEYDFHEARDIIGKHVKYQKDGILEADEYQFILPEFNGSPPVEVDMDAWLTFFGIWFGDGWVRSDGRVEIAANKQRVREALDECLPVLGFDYTYHENDKKLYVKPKQLVNYMQPLSVGAVNKSLPEWVWKLNAEQSKTLLYGLILSCLLYTSDAADDREV